MFFTPGEISAAAYGGYLTNATITGRFAQEIGGAVLMVEREFPDLPSNLLLTVRQTDTGAHPLRMSS